MLPPIPPICRLFPMLSDAEWMVEDIRRRAKLLVLQVLPLLEWEAKERQVRSPPEGKVAQKCATLLPGGAEERGRAVEHAARLVGAKSAAIQAAKRIQCSPDLALVSAKFLERSPQPDAPSTLNSGRENQPR